MVRGGGIIISLIIKFAYIERIMLHPDNKYNSRERYYYKQANIEQRKNNVR
jgi:hypothetical protein